MNDHNRRSDIAEDIFTYKAAKTETGTEEVFLKMKCPHCGTLNLIPVNRIIYPQKTPEHAISEPTMLYEPTKTTKCKKCNTTIARPEELIRLKQ
jgi:phage FluMu protein Com